MESLGPFLEQAVKATVRVRTKGVGERKLRQGKTTKSAEGLNYRTLFRESEVGEFSVLKELEPTAKEMIGWEAENDRVTSYDTAQRKRTVNLERRLGISEVKPAVPKTASRGNISRKKEEPGSGSKSSRETNIREVSGPRVKTV